MKIKKVFGISAIALAAIGVPAAVAQAQTVQNVKCTGTLGAVAVDNVEVPESASCTLNGTSVKGSIDVEPNARLSATAVHVMGNVQASEAVSVVVARSTIDGDVAVVQGGIARVTGNSIRGDILVDGQLLAVTVSNNQVGTGVGGNVELFGNLGVTTVRANRIAGNLQCKDNLPAPVGGSNVVGGNKEDQCLLL